MGPPSAFRHERLLLRQRGRLAGETYRFLRTACAVADGKRSPASTRHPGSSSSVNLIAEGYLTTLRAAGPMRNDMGSLPQLSPSSCTGTCAPGDLARNSLAEKESMERSRGLLASMRVRTSALRSRLTRSTRTTSSFPVV